ncbi:ArsS family sensor histidine kinase [Sulfuricurvum sp.]|uniref:ArsS family sensor histidine kinase n=1 Tax=Sulfuricurvum sp. TaxID=2025608 RepID=UPI002606650B|nr:ArsS family sensor histidine kinase [Sulfuricurvum sp.]MDD3596225.1 ArsS family sensor histidine kinase [Sulfuricurvum sp.]
MSIFTKITVLFLISLSLMIGISYQIDKINSQKYESLILQKYLLDGRKIFTWMATASNDELNRKLKTLNLIQTSAQPPQRYLLQQPHTFGVFEIYETHSEEYLLHIRYIDDDIYLRDTTLQTNQKEQWVLNALVAADIAVLIIIFAIILRMLSPLHSIAASMRRFASGEYDSRSRVRSSDEIGEVSQTYNDMAQTIENLIRAREELLRDVGHELRTPIARGLFAMEQIESSDASETLKRSLHELDQLTQTLLDIEKLHATDTLRYESFSAETLLLSALSKLCLNDESAIRIDMHANFTVQGDLNYLSLALKNLLDNALKYADLLPVIVEVSLHHITVANHAAALQKPFENLLAPFTRDEHSRTTHGFGLGLNIVHKILDKHGFQLSYEYHEGYHRFSIIFRSDLLT